MKDGSHVRLRQSSYRPETVHCSTKDAYTSEITFLALQPWHKLGSPDGVCWLYTFILDLKYTGFKNSVTGVDA